MKLIYVDREGGAYRLSGDLSWDDYMQIMETGAFPSGEICAIEVWMQPPHKDPEKARITMFDFELKRKGLPLIKCYRDAGPEAYALRSLR